MKRGTGGTAAAAFGSALGDSAFGSAISALLLRAWPPISPHIPPLCPGPPRHSPGPFKRRSLQKSKHTSQSRQRAPSSALPCTFCSSFATAHWFSLAHKPARLGVSGAISPALSPQRQNDIFALQTLPPAAPRAALASTLRVVFNKVTAPKTSTATFFFPSYDNLPLSS